MVTVPLYVKLKRGATSRLAGGQIQVVGATKVQPDPQEGVVVVKLELQLDEALFDTVIDTGATVKVSKPKFDSSAVVAKLNQVNKDLSEIHT